MSCPGLKIEGVPVLIIKGVVEIGIKEGGE